MNLYDNIIEYISNLPTMSNIKQWYDGDSSFKYGRYRGHVKLDVAKSEICVTFELNNQNFKDYKVLTEEEFMRLTKENKENYKCLSEVGLMFLANELSGNIEGVNFFIIPDTGLYMCLKKSYYYTSQDDALRFLDYAISELSIVAEATLCIASKFIFPAIPDDFFDIIDTELNKATFEYSVQRMPNMNILLVDDLFNPGIMGLKTQLKNRLHKCKIYEAEWDFNPDGVKHSLYFQIQENNIDLVMGYGSGCFVVGQLINVPKIFISPKFQFAEALNEHVEEYNPNVSSVSYDVDTARRIAVMSAEDMEDRQFFNLRYEDVDKTVAFFGTDNCSSKDATLYNMAYGPIRELLSESETFTDDIVRYEIIPAIYALYVKSHHPAYKGEVSRGEFAEHLRSIVYDKIAYGTPEVFGERAFVKVCPYTHDISLEHGYQEALLETMGKEGQIVPNEDQIRFLTLQRYPDDRIKGFIDELMNITEPYILNRSYKLSKLLLVVYRDDLSMEIKIKDKNNPIPKKNTEDIFTLSRFFKRDKRFGNYSIDLVRLTSVALKYISVDGLS